MGCWSLVLALLSLGCLDGATGGPFSDVGEDADASLFDTGHDTSPDVPPADDVLGNLAEHRLHRVEIVQRYPHDTRAFTQGLTWAGSGFFYESTGIFGESSLRLAELSTGRVVDMVQLDPEVFGEGLADVDGTLIQLTWRSQTAFIWSAADFSALGTLSYSTEGWGLAWTGSTLWMSDGTSTLRQRDPEDFRELDAVQVLDDDGSPVSRLNELEWIRGEIFANVWQTERIVRIDADTGRVLGWIEADGLLTTAEFGGPDDVLNGIAWDDGGQQLFLTGKRWPWIFSVRLVPVP